MEIGLLLFGERNPYKDLPLWNLTEDINTENPAAFFGDYEIYNASLLKLFNMPCASSTGMQNMK